MNNAIDELKNRNPRLFEMKPHLHIFGWLNQTPQSTCEIIFAGRRNTDSGKWVCSGNNEPIRNVVHHTLNECANPMTTMSRLVARQQIQEICPQILKAPTEWWAMIGLGRIIKELLNEEEAERIRLITIQLLIDGRKTLTTIV
jgi:hypothetical protein